MNLLKYPKTYLSLIALGVFVLLTLPKITLAQTDGAGDGDIEDFLQGILWDILTMIGGFMVWFGGKLLNYAVTYYVVGFGNFFITSGLGDSINSLWSIIRDVFNLTFIFGLVFIGFKLIFGDSSAKRALGTLIMAALLVNFSLFITKFIIDFSNIAAAQFAAAFLIGTEYNLSEGFMRLFGLSGIFSTGNPLPTTAGWTYIFLTFFLFVVAAFVFIAGGLMLIIRFVVLNLYMILSPIMFLGWVFPGFSGTSRQYWSGFLQRAFFAPAYLLMIYLSHQVLVNMRMSAAPTQKLNGIATSDSATANAAFDQTIPLFLVSIIFLIASLIVAQKMGAQGATSAIAIGKRMTNRARQVTTGFAADKVRRGLDAAASMDPNKKTGSNALNALRWATRGAARAANATGARDYFDEASKPYTDIYDTVKKRKAAQAARDSAARQKETIDEGVRAQADLDEHIKNGTLNPAIEATLRKKIDDMAMAVSSLSTKLLEEMSDSQLSAISEYLTNSQVENLMKSDKLSDNQKNLVVSARQKAITKMLTKTGSVLAEEITKLSIEQIETMGEKWIDTNVQHFSKSQMDDLKKSKKFTETRKASFATQRKSHQAAVIATGSLASIVSLFETSPGKRKKPEDIAELGNVLVSNMHITTRFLKSQDLREIGAKNTITPAEKKTLEGYIRGAYVGGNKTELVDYLDSAHGKQNW